MSQISEARVLTITEVAAILRVSGRTAYQLAADGKVPAIKVGGQWRISRSALDRYLEEAP